MAQEAESPWLAPAPHGAGPGWGCPPRSARGPAREAGVTKCAPRGCWLVQGANPRRGPRRAEGSRLNPAALLGIWGGLGAHSRQGGSLPWTSPSSPALTVPTEHTLDGEHYGHVRLPLGTALAGRCRRFGGGSPPGDRRPHRAPAAGRGPGTFHQVKCRNQLV